MLTLLPLLSVSSPRRADGIRLPGRRPRRHRRGDRARPDDEGPRASRRFARGSKSRSPARRSRTAQLMQDSTVLQVELDGFTLSVKTKLERPEVHELAKLAKASQVGDDVHLIFPRHARRRRSQLHRRQDARRAAEEPTHGDEPPSRRASRRRYPRLRRPAAAAPVSEADLAHAPAPAKQTPIPPERSRDWN